LLKHKDEEIMRQRLLVLVMLLLSLSLMLPAQAQEDRLQIVASHSILADVVANVAGDAADVTSTMPRGADPHSFQPTPNELTALANADVVFINGALFEEGLLEAIENAGTDMNIVTASSCVEIIAFSEHDHEEGEHDHEEDHTHEDEEATALGSEIASLCELHYAEMAALHEAGHDHEDEVHDHEEEATEEEHDHEEATEEEHDHAEEATEEEHDHSHGTVETLGPLYTLACEGHDHEGEAETEGEHDHGNCDPHVWLDPHNAMYWTMLIRDELI
jgi:zinc transport system substrate-binding protein